jgi:hypothetical protein
MKSLVQFVVGTAVMVVLAPSLFGTPLYHWIVFAVIFAGAMYGVALVQHWFYLRFSRRGVLLTPGSRPNGTPFKPS